MIDCLIPEKLLSYSVPMMIFHQGQFFVWVVMSLRRSTEARANLDFFFAFNFFMHRFLAFVFCPRKLFASLVFFCRLVYFDLPHGAGMPMMMLNSRWVHEYAGALSWWYGQEAFIWGTRRRQNLSHFPVIYSFACFLPSESFSICMNVRFAKIGPQTMWLRFPWRFLHFNLIFKTKIHVFLVLTILLFC